MLVLDLSNEWKNYRSEVVKDCLIINTNLKTEQALYTPGPEWGKIMMKSGMSQSGKGYHHVYREMLKWHMTYKGEEVFMGTEQGSTYLTV